MEGTLPLTRAPDLWFEDGTIILQAETRLFRVYKGILSLHSSVFRDMFSFPQPNDQSLVEGCMVVVVHDSAEDMTEFLKAIHISR